MTEKLRACGVLLFREDPHLSFLLMKHPTRWDLPKGHVDPGETDLECALRETYEETGIAPDKFELLSDFRFETEYLVRRKRDGFRPIPKSLRVYLGRLKSPQEVVLSEHEDYRWWNWSPPHRIQPLSIDPLLEAVERYSVENAATWSEWLKQ